MKGPQRVLMTVDAVGGVWRYAIDLARGLNHRGIACLLVGAGPRSGGALAFEALGLPDTELVWTDETLDWMADDEAALDGTPAILAGLARDWRADLLHLNLPSQAAGIGEQLPVVVASHSCVPTWWDAMRSNPLPAEWAWQHRRNRRGFDRADRVLVPSASHAAALIRAYGTGLRLSVVYNSTATPLSDDEPGDDEKQPFVLAAGRWWDPAKNAATLDLAAASSPWPVRMAGSLAGPNAQAIALGHARSLGELAPEALLGLMRASAIFASPSRYEPFGLAVLEAATQHATLVLADIPTFRELWQDAALFVPATDAAGFAQAIARLAHDPPLRRQLAAQASRIAHHFTPARQLEGMIGAYAGAMMRHEHRRRGAG